MSRNKKLTDTQLSCILGEHDCLQLQLSGRFNWGRETFFNYETRKSYYAFSKDIAPQACVNQVAFNEPDLHTALKMCPTRGDWFDKEYNSFWSVEKFLEELEKRGFCK